MEPNTNDLATAVAEDITEHPVKIRKKGSLYVIERKKSLFERLRSSAFANAAFVLAGATTLCTGAAVYAENSPENSLIDFTGAVRSKVETIQGRPADPEDLTYFTERLELNLTSHLTPKLLATARAFGEYGTNPTVYPLLVDHTQSGIDRLNLQFTPNASTQLQLGEFENTFTGWFDKDLPLVGVQAKMTWKDILSLDSLVAKAAYHIGQPLLEESDTKLWAVELQGTKDIADGVHLTLTINYMDWSSLDTRYFRTNAKQNGEFLSDFNIANAEMRLVDDNISVPIFHKPLTWYAKGMHNFGAEKENNGLITGIKFGDTKKPGDLSLEFQYRFIEQDSIFGAYSPKDTPGSNFDQFIILGGWKPTKNLTVTPALTFPKRHDKGDRYIYGGLTIRYEF